MIRNETFRPGELAAGLPDRADAEIYFIGTIYTPWATREACPRQGDPKGPECRIEVEPNWERALEGLAGCARIQVLYWMHQARRDLLVQVPRLTGVRSGTFALRSPARPNPIASSVVDLVSVERTTLIVRGLDCLDGTPLLDIKPARDRP